MAGQLSGVFAAGELARVRPESSDAICGCGAPLETCTVWSKILAAWRLDVGETLSSDVSWIAQNRSRRRHIPYLLLSSAIGGRAATRMQRVHQSLLRAIHSTTTARWIVDSSKDPARAIALAHTAGVEIRIIHLTRDPRGVTCSLMKSIKRSPIAGVPRSIDGVPPKKAARAWQVADAAASRVARRFPPQHVLGVRYETMLRSPDSVRASVADFLGIEHHAERAGGRDVPLGHIASGNRLRMNGRLSIQLEDEWADSLSPADRSVIERACRRKMALLGYGDSSCEQTNAPIDPLIRKA